MRNSFIQMLNMIFSYKYSSLRHLWIILGILSCLIGVMGLMSAYVSIGTFKPPLKDELKKETGVIYEKHRIGRGPSKVRIVNEKYHSEYSSPLWKNWQNDIGETAYILVSRNKVWELTVNGQTKFNYDKTVNNYNGFIVIVLKALGVGILIITIYLIFYIYWKINGTLDVMPYPITTSNGDKLFGSNNVDDIFNAGVSLVAILAIIYIMKDSVLLYIFGFPSIIVIGITGRAFYMRARNNISPLIINKIGIKCCFFIKQIGDDFIPWNNINKIDSFMLKGQSMALLHLNDKKK